MDDLSRRMNKLADKYQNEMNFVKIRALNQCARELLLLQSSDWYFNLTCHRVEEYSYKRINTHIERFNELDKQIKNNKIDQEFLKYIEYEDNIFPEINFKDYKIV